MNRRMRQIVIMLVLAAAFALPALAQMSNQPAFGSAAPVAPTMTFQSTSSAMMNSGSAYSANPTIGEDGTAAYAAPKTATRPLRPDDGTIHTTRPTDHTKTPLGDALWPLMFLALAFGGYVALRRRRASSKE